MDINEFREWVVEQKNQADDTAYHADDDRKTARHEGKQSAFDAVEWKLVQEGLVDHASTEQDVNRDNISTPRGDTAAD